MRVLPHGDYFDTVAMMREADLADGFLLDEGIERPVTDPNEVEISMRRFQ